MLPSPPARVLELGCGDGRVLAPISHQGHCVVAIDRDPEAISACRNRLDASADAQLIEADFQNWLRSTTSLEERFDAVLCLGNTFMTIVELDEAVAVLARAAQLLVVDGVLILDDLPQDLWPELTEGNWQSGVSEDGSSQLLWHPDDAIFTIRYGSAVDLDAWHFTPSDTLYRLWTSSALTMASRLAGLSDPEHHPNAGLIVMRSRIKP